MGRVWVHVVSHAADVHKHEPRTRLAIGGRMKLKNEASIVLKLAMLMLAGFMFIGHAAAKDGDSGGGNSGSGSDNSGSGSDDDNDDDDDEDDDLDSSSGSSKSGDHNSAYKAVKKGKAVSLRKLKVHLAQNYPGKILSINLLKSRGSYYYRVRILSSGNRIKTVTLNALNLKMRTS